LLIRKLCASLMFVTAERS